MAENETTEPKIRPGIVGGPKPPNSGRQKGTPNKKNVLSIDTVREQVAAEMGKDSKDITATRILYLVANRADKILGLKDGEITLEQSIDAASKLANYEVPKKRAIEVTGVELAGGSFVISTGQAPPENETDEQFANRAERETKDAEAEGKRKRLAELEAEKREREEANKKGQW